MPQRRNKKQKQPEPAASPLGSGEEGVGGGGDGGGSGRCRADDGGGGGASSEAVTAFNTSASGAATQAGPRVYSHAAVGALTEVDQRKVLVAFVVRVTPLLSHPCFLHPNPTRTVSFNRTQPARAPQSCHPHPHVRQGANERCHGADSANLSARSCGCVRKTPHAAHLGERVRLLTAAAGSKSTAVLLAEYHGAAFKSYIQGHTRSLHVLTDVVSRRLGVVVSDGVVKKAALYGTNHICAGLVFGWTPRASPLTRTAADALVAELLPPPSAAHAAPVTTASPPASECEAPVACEAGWLAPAHVALREAVAGETDADAPLDDAAWQRVAVGLGRPPEH